MTQLENALTVWTSLFEGEPPSREQFAIWTLKYSEDVVGKGFIATAVHNQKMSGEMTLNHRIRFASRVMWTKVNDPQKRGKIA